MNTAAIFTFATLAILPIGILAVPARAAAAEGVRAPTVREAANLEPGNWLECTRLVGTTPHQRCAPGHFRRLTIACDSPSLTGNAVPTCYPFRKQEWVAELWEDAPLDQHPGVETSIIQLKN